MSKKYDRKPTNMTAHGWPVLFRAVIFGVAALVLNGQAPNSVSALASGDSVHLVRPLALKWPKTEAEASLLRSDRWLIEDLLREMFPDDGPFGTFYGLQEFRFVRLERNKFYLVAVIDLTSQGRFNNIKAISCVGQDCEVADAVSNGDVELDSQLLDVDNDGIWELVVRSNTFMSGMVISAGPQVYTYQLMSLRGRMWVDVSASHRKVFRDKIRPMMEADHAGLPEMVTEFESGLAEALGADSEDRREMFAHRLETAASLKAALSYSRLALAQVESGGTFDPLLRESEKWLQSAFEPVQRLGVRTMEAFEPPENVKKRVRTLDLSKLTSRSSERLSELLERSSKNSDPK